MYDNEHYMNLAIREANKALANKEVPIGAVIVDKKTGKIVGRGFNKKELKQDPLAHAELIAIKSATRKLENWRLNNTVLYSTIEPCAMCAGAIIQSRIPKVVFGARDPRFGGLGSLVNLSNKKLSNHRFEVTEGIKKEEVLKILKDFFEKARKNKKAQSNE